jgi:hypothetical protein
VEWWTCWTAREAVAALRPVFEHGAYLDVVRVNVAETWLWLATDDPWKTGAASFGKFLLGFWAARTGILLRAGTDQEGTSRTLLRRGLAWGLALGVVCQGVLLVVPETWVADVGLDLLYRAGIPGIRLSPITFKGGSLKRSFTFTSGGGPSRMLVGQGRQGRDGGGGERGRLLIPVDSN